MSLNTRRLLGWLASLIWASFIFYMSSRPGSTLPGGYSVQAHLAEYAVFGVLLSLAFAERDIDLATVGLVVLVASIYGVTDEYHQHFVAMRTPDIADWALDTTGAAAGALAAYWITTRSRRSNRSVT